MKPTELKAPRRRKRSSEEFSFTKALETAKNLLQKKTTERNDAIHEVDRLNIEIGGLEGTINALNRQLNPTHDFSIADIGKYAGRITPPGEVPEGAGSILTGQGEAPQQTAPDLDSLPGMGGDFA